MKQEETVFNNDVIKSMSWIIYPSQPGQKGGLALGNLYFAQDHSLLSQNNLQTIVTVMGQAQLKLDPTIKHMRICIADSPGQNIRCFFQSTKDFIKNSLKDHNVLIHCKAGVSRSATIVCAYLMVQQKMPFKEAIELIKSRRDIVEPNKGFLRQLKSFDKELVEQRNKSNCQIY